MICLDGKLITIFLFCASCFVIYVYEMQIKGKLTNWRVTRDIRMIENACHTANNMFEGGCMDQADRLK